MFYNKFHIIIILALRILCIWRQVNNSVELFWWKTGFCIKIHLYFLTQSAFSVPYSLDLVTKVATCCHKWRNTWSLAVNDLYTQVAMVFQIFIGINWLPKSVFLSFYFTGRKFQGVTVTVTFTFRYKHKVNICKNKRSRQYGNLY